MPTRTAPARHPGDHGGVFNLQVGAEQPGHPGPPDPGSPGHRGPRPYPGDTGGAGDTHGAEGQRPHHPVLVPGVQLVEVLVRHEDGPVPALTEAVDLRGQGQRGDTPGGDTDAVAWQDPSPCSPLTLRTWQEKRTEPKCTLSLRVWRRRAKGSASPGFSLGCGEPRRGVGTAGRAAGHPQTRRRPLTEER